MGMKYLGISLDLKGNIEEQIRAGAAIYQQRTGDWPDTILANQSLPIPDELAPLGMEVHREKFVQPHLVYIGIAEPENELVNMPKNGVSQRVTLIQGHAK